MEPFDESALIVQRAFPGISVEEAHKMVAVGASKAYAQGVPLCREGEVETIFYILLSGRVRVTKTINDEQVRHLGDLAPGDFFGEMALIHDAPRNASIVTLEPCTVLEIHKDDFDQLVRQNSSVSVAMVREVSRRLRENNDLAVDALRLKASELALAYQQLAELEMARSEFLSVVAHELRTPLTVANGFLQIVRSESLSGEAMQSALSTIGKNLQDITALVNDILFLQEMEIILPAFQVVDVGAILAAAVERQRESALRSQVGLGLAIAPGLPSLMGDERSLERALLAILDNAVKFSPDGGAVNVDVTYDEGFVWVRVEDHGVGIPPVALPRIFERFFHLEQVGGRLFRGVGLGLSIARQVIELHEGCISVDSELGKGSVVTVCLPR
jgi:signal transduction histidine kinase